MRSKKHVRKKKVNKRRVFETILSVFILTSILIGGVTGYYGSKVVSFLGGISDDDNTVETPEAIEITKQVREAKPFSALILGVDVEDGGISRSDTIIVATVNPRTESMKMVSIPRDTLVTLPNGTIEKMNAAYATGGARRAREMVGEFLDIDIDFYATLDFRGLIELVDAVGGITVDSELAFVESNYENPSDPIRIEKGIQDLTGAEALGYARMRKKDPRGDFGRQDRQKEVIAEVLKELVSFNSISNLPGILNAVQPYLQTNARSSDILSIAANYTTTLRNIEQLTITGADDRVYFPHYGHDVYVWEPFSSSLEEVQLELQEHLAADDTTTPEIRSATEETLASPSEQDEETSDNH